MEAVYGFKYIQFMGFGFGLKVWFWFKGLGSGSVRASRAGLRAKFKKQRVISEICI